MGVPTARYRLGDSVCKTGAGYSGPGRVAAVFSGNDGHVRYVVAHQIEAGSGEFFHIYGEAQLRLHGKLDMVLDASERLPCDHHDWLYEKDGIHCPRCGVPMFVAVD